MSVNDQLDELLASFDAPSSSSSSTPSRASQAMDDFDFLDNFLAEMEAEKKPAGGGGGALRGSASPQPARPVARPSTKADDLLSELEDIVNEKPSDVVLPSKKPPVASAWKAVDVAVPAKPKEVSLDTSKDIRALKKELNSVHKELASKESNNKKGDDLEGFEVAKLKPKVATKAVSLDSPEELELLQAELAGTPVSGRRPTNPAQSSAGEGYTTRAKPQPQRKPMIQGGGPQQPVSPKPTPVMQRPTIQQQPTAQPVPLPATPSTSFIASPSTPGRSGGRPAAPSASIEDFDRLLDEISPSTIRRMPDPKRPSAVDAVLPPLANTALPRDPSIDEMDSLMGDLDLNLGRKGSRPPPVALSTLADLDEVEKALGLDKPKEPVRRPPPPPQPESELPGVDDVLAKLDSVVERTHQARKEEERAYPPLSSQLAALPPSEQKLKEKATKIAEQIKVKEQSHDYVSGYRVGGSGGTLDSNRENVKKVEKNLDLILEGIDPQLERQRQEKERQEKEAKQKKDAELSSLLSGLDEDLKKKQEMERKRKEQEELERKRKKEEEERRRLEKKKMDLDAIEEMVENLSPIGFLDTPSLSGGVQTVGQTSHAVVTQNLRQHTEQTQEEREYNNIQVKLKELARMTGQNLWTAKGDARIDISAITEFLKASVVQARAVAEERGNLDPKLKDTIVDNCKIALQTVPAFVSGMKKFHAATKANEDAARSGIPVDKSVTDEILRECQIARMQMLKAYEILLESYMYSPNSTVTIKRASSTPLQAAAPGEAPIKLFKDTVPVDDSKDAKNSILYAFKDFYLGANETAPKPNTIEALSYVPWKPQYAMKEYCAQSVGQFKEIVNVINLPMKSFDFKLFATVITKEVELMVPIAKMIRMQPERYSPFAKFPLGTKVFVNACINFIDAVNVYKTKGVTAEALALARGDADYLNAVAKKNELNNTLKMLLTVLQNILVAEKNARPQGF